jgi:2-methylisocitrate lyase-like PEP mutase family enzyme
MICHCISPSAIVSPILYCGRVKKKERIERRKSLKVIISAHAATTKKFTPVFVLVARNNAIATNIEKTRTISMICVFR